MTTVPQNLDRVASLIHAKLEMRIAKANSFRRKPHDRHDCYKASGHMRRGTRSVTDVEVRTLEWTVLLVSLFTTAKHTTPTGLRSHQPLSADE